MRNPPAITGVLLGLTALAASSASLAQSVPTVTYEVLRPISAIPTLSEWGLIFLSALLLGGAFFFFRQARGGSSKLLSLVIGLVAVGVLSTNHDVIGKAWAKASWSVSFDQGRTVVNLDQGAGPYDINNPGPNPVRITGFTGDGESCLQPTGMLEQPIGPAQLNGNGNYWRICPHGFVGCPPAPTPGCLIGSEVPAAGTCYLTLSCVSPALDPA